MTRVGGEWLKGRGAKVRSINGCWPLKSLPRVEMGRLPTRPPTAVRRGFSGAGMALPLPRSLRLARPGRRLQRLPGHLGCGPPAPRRIQEREHARGRWGRLEHSPVWVCFSFLLRSRPGFPCCACGSGPRRVPRRLRRRRLRTPPRRAAPSVAGPVTCVWEPLALSRWKPLGEVPGVGAESSAPPSCVK